MSSLILEKVSYQYQQQAVISDLDLTVAHNEIVCLLGASGCGKTTTLKAIAGLIKPQSGRIAIHGQCVSNKQFFVAPQHRNIGMMFQDYALFPHLSVFQNIAFGLSKLNNSERNTRVAQMIELVRLEGLEKRFPHELSGGQQQRVAIARALAYKPNLLLLDEPFSNIDTQVRFQLINDIRSIIKDQQVSAIFVSHSKDEAFAFADKLAIMHEGKIAQLDSAKTLFQQPKTKAVAEFLGQGIYLDAQRYNGQSVTTQFGDVSSLITLSQSQTSGQIYVRPQHLELINDPQGDVEIVQQRFIGTDYVYHIKVADQQLEVPAPAEQLLDTTKPVSLKIKAHAVNFFS
ncbi:Fe(3+) ions import ATP-binding protein FbpC 2 [Pseudoalteromonas holothuriae]|uniref:Fe(3+) ions import ATP-binding protein FbpC 2 n=1 Tax=Pseudoalteromonas holothuriae TaxID=2963714 RepID=A0ABM9GGN1_9GAMM|nr:ABC transporter ATP-binding protein [Pseudoalteromonas sp. CIP111951]CAH9056380.1 Fe(3+) ions import ATP-binding protein FbpC 2 [Pseudoalteromonas sp. CIP111951]